MKVIIVDDHALFLQGVAALLEHQMPKAVIETYSNIHAAFQALRNDKTTDLVLADIHMPKHDDETLMELMFNAHIFVPILLVSATDDILVIKRALDLHAAGFIHKSSQPRDLLNAIQCVLKHGSFLEEELARRLARVQESLLSARQQQVLSLLATGLSNRHIGEQLGISEVTVKSHVSALFDYFDACNRLDCIRKAERLGMVASNSETSL